MTTDTLDLFQQSVNRLSQSTFTPERVKREDVKREKNDPESPARRQRARKLRQPIGPFQTSATSFEQGRDRAIEIVTLTPSAIVYRLKGRAETYVLPHPVGFAKALSIAAGFDTGPRSGRVRRGAVGGVR